VVALSIPAHAVPVVPGAPIGPPGRARVVRRDDVTLTRRHAIRRATDVDREKDPGGRPQYNRNVRISVEVTGTACPLRVAGSKNQYRAEIRACSSNPDI